MLKWVYSKHSGGDSGEDLGRIDFVQLVAELWTESPPNYHFDALGSAGAFSNVTDDTMLQNLLGRFCPNL